MDGWLTNHSAVGFSGRISSEALLYNAGFADHAGALVQPCSIVAIVWLVLLVTGLAALYKDRMSVLAASAVLSMGLSVLLITGAESGMAGIYTLHDTGQLVVQSSWQIYLSFQHLAQALGFSIGNADVGVSQSGVIFPVPPILLLAACGAAVWLVINRCPCLQR